MLPVPIYFSNYFLITLGKFKTFFKFAGNLFSAFNCNTTQKCEVLLVLNLSTKYF